MPETPKSAAQPRRNMDQFNKLIEKFETWRDAEEETALELSQADVEELIEGVKSLREARPL